MRCLGFFSAYQGQTFIGPPFWNVALFYCFTALNQSILNVFYTQINRNECPLLSIGKQTSSECFEMIWSQFSRLSYNCFIGNQGCKIIKLEKGVNTFHSNFRTSHILLRIPSEDPDP